MHRFSLGLIYHQQIECTLSVNDCIIIYYTFMKNDNGSETKSVQFHLNDYRSRALCSAIPVI